MNGNNQTIAGLSHSGVRSLTGSRSVVNTSGTAVTLTLNTPANQSYSGTIGGTDINGTAGNNLALVKRGSGTQTLSGANTYSGKTSVEEGTLILDQAFLNNNADVQLTPGATLQLDFAGTEIIDELLINGSPQASGTWGRIGHPTAAHTTSRITGDGLLQVSTGPFSGWARNNGATGQTPDQDHDNDGVPNGIEYFMGQTGSPFTVMPGLDGTNTVTWAKDPAYNGTWQVQTSPDLSTWTNVSGTDNGTSVSYLLPVGLGKQFVRLLVTPTP